MSKTEGGGGGYDRIPQVDLRRLKFRRWLVDTGRMGEFGHPAVGPEGGVFASELGIDTEKNDENKKISTGNHPGIKWNGRLKEDIAEALLNAGEDLNSSVLRSKASNCNQAIDNGGMNGEPDVAKWKFLRWLSENDRLDHGVASSPRGKYSPLPQKYIMPYREKLNLPPLESNALLWQQLTEIAEEKTGNLPDEPQVLTGADNTKGLKIYGEYDPDLHMFVEEPRELDMEMLKFLKHLALRERLEHSAVRNLRSLSPIMIPKAEVTRYNNNNSRSVKARREEKAA